MSLIYLNVTNKSQDRKEKILNERVESDTLVVLLIFSSLRSAENLWHQVIVSCRAD